MMNRVLIGKDVLNTEIESLISLKACMDDTFDEIVSAILFTKGKIIIIGMGKSGHVAGKMAATMSSLGTCAISLNPGECMHGDLGMIQEQDLVMLISYSGESDEIKTIIPGIRRIGAPIIGITGKKTSNLAQNADLVQILPDISEACHLGVAPTSSTTCAMAYGDALAVTIAKEKQFTKAEFAQLHPAGALGKALTVRAIDIMIKLSSESLVRENSTLLDAALIMAETGVDMAVCVDDVGALKGVVRKGSLREAIGKGISMTETVKAVISKERLAYVDESAMAIDALNILVENDLTSIPVINEERVLGIIRKSDIESRGIRV